MITCTENPKLTQILDSLNDKPTCTAIPLLTKSRASRHAVDLAVRKSFADHAEHQQQCRLRRHSLRNAEDAIQWCRGSESTILDIGKARKAFANSKASGTHSNARFRYGAFVPFILDLARVKLKWLYPSTEV